MLQRSSRALSSWERFHLYALHGVFVEVCYTALFDLWFLNDWRFTGTTSVFSYLTYGLGIFIIEAVYLALKERTPFVFRGFIYVLISYAIELSFGGVCSHFNYPLWWDYSQFKYNYKGFITLEYAPLWFSGGMLAEMVISRLLQIRIQSVKNDDHNN